MVFHTLNHRGSSLKSLVDLVDMGSKALVTSYPGLGELVTRANTQHLYIWLYRDAVYYVCCYCRY